MSNGKGGSALRRIVFGLLIVATLVLVVRYLDDLRARAAQDRLSSVLASRSLLELERHIDGPDNAALWLAAAGAAVRQLDRDPGLARLERQSGCSFFENHPNLPQELLEENRIALVVAHLAEEATDSSFGIDYSNGNRLRWPNLLKQIQLSRLLHLEGRRRLCHGDLEGALATTRTLRQLRDALDVEPLPLFQILGASVGNRYLGLVREWLALPEPPDDVLRELAATSPHRELISTLARTLSLEAMLARSEPSWAHEGPDEGADEGLLTTLVDSLQPQRRRTATMSAHATRLESLHAGDLASLDAPDLWFQANQLATRLRLDHAQRQLLRAAVQLRLGDQPTETLTENSFTRRPLTVDRNSEPPVVRIPGGMELWRSTVDHGSEAPATVFELPIGPRR